MRHAGLRFDAKRLPFSHLSTLAVPELKTMRRPVARLVSISFLLALPLALMAQAPGRAPATQAQIAALEQEVTVRSLRRR